MAHKKTQLPEKICLHCQRPFTWRKKWQRCWQEVRFCSQRCKQTFKSLQKQPSHAATSNLCAAGQVEDEF